MKEQTKSEVISSIIESDIIKHESNPKKVSEYGDNSSAENDAGYMTSSSDSLHADDSWKLNIPPKLNKLSDEEIQRVVRDIKSEINQIPVNERREWLLKRLTEYYSSAMPTSLIELSTSHFFDGDSGISGDVRPDWLDMDKFRRGQQVVSEHLFGVFYAELISLFTVFTFDDGLKPLILTDASSTPYTSFKRYLSTSSRIYNWYTSDPWTAGTPAYKDMRAVRRIHAMIRKKIQETPYEEYVDKTTIKQPWCPSWSVARRDLESTCPSPKPGQCPYFAVANFPELKEKKLSQGEMAATQFSFVGILILYPKFFGLHDVTDDDLDAFCHMWKGLGYLLGIADEWNFCRGTLEDVKTRSRDFLDYWVKPNFRVVSPEWEHMMRCVIEGVNYYFPGATYETCLLDLAEIMNLHMPRIYNSMSYPLWIRHNIIRFYFNQGSKFYPLRSILNRTLVAALERALNYDESKHKQLQDRSARTMDSYILQTTKYSY